MERANSDTERSQVVAATLAAVGAWLGPALLVGLALPLHSGWGLPLIAVAIALAVHTLRTRKVGSLSAVLDNAPASARLIAFAIVGLAVVVIATVAARAVAGLVVAYPAALWAVPVALAGVVVTRLGRASVPVVLGLAVAVPVAGVLGTRYEEGGTDAQGWAQSGPIHGIHPGQTTAVVVDGYGPFDLPVNDYVEPAGDRGYGPEAFAEMVEEALHRVAEIQYADGPSRARMALGGAEVEAFVTDAVRERLSREPQAEEQPRFVVRSGTFGQRSKVEFVCPGRREDPRGHPGENVMNRMCPTKYASEASAGLGVTGRWPGYAEARGNERLGLSRLLGWTRSDDKAGADVLTAEQHRIAWLCLFGIALLVAVPKLRAAQGVSAVGGAVGVGALGMILALALGAQGQPLQVGFVESTRVHATGSSLVPWLAALLLIGGVPALGRDTTPAQLQGIAWGRRLAAAAVAVVALMLAGNLAALDWVTPVLYGEADGGLAMQAWVAGAAEAVGERFGLTILEVEGAIAAALVAALLGGIAHVLGVAGSSAERLGTQNTRRLRLLGIVAVVLAAAAVTVSRKTMGGATLLPGAIGLTAILHSGLYLLWGGVRPLAAAFQVLLVAMGLGLVWFAVDSAGPHPFVLLCVAVGGLAAVAGLALPAFRSRSPGA